MRHRTRPRVWLSLLLMLGISAAALANPNDYPEYAQHKVDGDISITFMKPEDVKANLDTKVQQTLIDVRKTNQFQKTHLPGAVSMPLRKLPERHAEIPRDTPTVFYWACPHHLASLAYQYLYRLGYRNIYVLEEGLPGWEKRKYPLEGKSQQATLQ